MPPTAITISARCLDGLDERCFMKCLETTKWRTLQLPICPVISYTISFSTVSLSVDAVALLSLLLSANRRARNVANWGPFCAIPKGFLA